MTQGTEKAMIVKCSFEKKLNMPPKCVSCYQPISNKLFDVSAYTTFRASRATFRFPVCDACFLANHGYVEISTILVISSVALLLSILTLLNPPSYPNIPRGWFLLGGVIWLTILGGWMVMSVIRARRQNSPELVARRSNLRDSVKALKLVPPRGSQRGEVTFTFKNHLFAREFKRLNSGKVPR